MFKHASLNNIFYGATDILILDEATSGLDTLLEHAIMNYLLNLKEKTIIFIAHHLPIAKACDQILVLHEGHLVEKGTHDELRFADGIYQKSDKIISFCAATR
ncbi:hypothetical protein EfmAA96_24870 [Enterococcus faecium]|nr:hypothetical protein EfmAA96_24870 [Enterococcus faecium]